MKTKYKFLSIMITPAIVAPVILPATTNFFHDNNTLKSNLGDVLIINANDCTAQHTNQNANTWMGITGDQYVQYQITEPASGQTESTAIIYGVSAMTITSEKLSIPSYIMYNAIKYNVISIGDNNQNKSNAFFGCKNLKGPLSIGSNIKNIANRSFYDCVGLTGTVSITNGVETIGEGAFENCTGFTSAFIAGSVLNIGDFAFTATTAITNVKFQSITPPLTLGSSIFVEKINLSNSKIVVQVPENAKSNYDAIYLNLGIGSTNQIFEPQPDPTSIEVENVQNTYRINFGSKLIINPTAKITPDNAHSSVTWSLTNDPIDGLKIDSKTGVITFLPRAIGSYVLKIQAKSSVADVWTPVKETTVSVVDPGPISVDIENIDSTYEIQVNNELTINPTVKITPDSEQKNVTWILVSDPIDGLSLDTTTGVIKYLSTTAGEYVLKIQARSNINNRTSLIKEATITVMENDQPIPASNYDLPLIITFSVIGVLSIAGVISAFVFNAKKKSKKA